MQFKTLKTASATIFAPRPHLWHGEQREPGKQLAKSHHSLLSDGDPTSRPFPPTTELSFTGFFFPLLKPVLWMGCDPVIRQQGFQGGSVSGRKRGKTS